MTFVAVVTGAIAVTAGTISAIQASKKEKAAAERAREAQKRLDKEKSLFRNLDTSNPYLDMENVYEDVTVNQQQAQFERDQQMQAQANIMQQMRGAAGSSGIAALAQTLANQGSLDAQKASATIGQQEAENQKLKLAEEARLRGLEREGELVSRQAQFGKISSLMGLSAQEVAGHQAAQAQAASQQAQAYGQISQGAVLGSSAELG